MTSSQAPKADRVTGALRLLAPSVSADVFVLTRRADFLRTAKGLRQSMPGLTLQARPRETGGTAIRIGLTCSKKIGNAVVRNRAKRRLRAIARETLPQDGRPGWDYVIIGRPDATIARPFDDLRRDLSAALRRVHAARSARPAAEGPAT